MHAQRLVEEFEQLIDNDNVDLADVDRLLNLLRHNLSELQAREISPGLEQAHDEALAKINIEVWECIEKLDQGGE